MTIASRLRTKYKTRESLEKEVTAAGSKTQLAKNLGVSRQNLNEHVRYLAHGNNRSVLKKNWGLKTVAETNANIKEFFPSELSKVEVYQMTDDYVPGTYGYEGLVYLRTDEQKTISSPWTIR